MQLLTHWIDGKNVHVNGSRTGPVFDPATGEQTGEVAYADAEMVDAAVRSAATAFETWKDAPLTRRQNIMFSFRELVAKHRLDLAKAVTKEHGKTIDDALGEVQRGLEVIEFVTNIAHLLKGEYSEQVSTGVDTFNLRQPLGVVAGITPFNFPVMVPMWMYPVAIACGNTFVLKPSEKDPGVNQLAAELFAEAGLPEGVFNVVHGDKEAVDAILDHPDIAAVSFVGSTPVARAIWQRGTANGKRVQALGGAKNHMIVLPDADMDLAADAAVSAGFGSAGERCMAISVVVTVGDAADRLLPKVRERMSELVVGPGEMEGAQMGPLVTAAHRDRVRGYVDADPDALRADDRRGRRREGRGDAARRRAGPRDRRPRGRLLLRTDPVRSGRAFHVDLHRRDLRPGAVGGPSRSLLRGDRPHQQQPLRKRHCRVHQ